MSACLSVTKNDCSPHNLFERVLCFIERASERGGAFRGTQRPTRQPRRAGGRGCGSGAPASTRRRRVCSASALGACATARRAAMRSRCLCSRWPSSPLCQAQSARAGGRRADPVAAGTTMLQRRSLRRCSAWLARRGRPCIALGAPLPQHRIATRPRRRAATCSVRRATR